MHGAPLLLWDAFTQHDVKLATSYYSDDSNEHDQVTGLRGSHRKTRANVQKGLELGIPMRGGVVAVRPGQRVEEAARDLVSLGVPQVCGDRTRAFGRASQGAAPTVKDLCGHCAHEKCAIGPTGDVWPCALGRFLTMGNVLEKPISDIWGGVQAARVTAGIAAVHGRGVQSCTPPQFLPLCGPCGPCVPSVGHCDPREATAEVSAVGAPASPAQETATMKGHGDDFGAWCGGAGSAAAHRTEEEWLTVARYVRHAANKLLPHPLPVCLPGEPQQCGRAAQQHVLAWGLCSRLPHST